MPFFLQPSSVPQAQWQAIYDALLAETLRRAGIGAVETGGSSSQTFGMKKLSDDALLGTLNAFGQALGVAPQPIVQVAPNFAGTNWNWPYSNP